MKRPFMQEDLRENRLIAILDVLMEADGESLTVNQIQYRLGRDRNLSLSRDEVEALLNWGAVQPGATNAPIKPRQVYLSNKWIAVAKRPLTAAEHVAAGPPPWLDEPESHYVRTMTVTPEGKRIPGRVSQSFLDKIQSGEIPSYSRMGTHQSPPTLSDYEAQSPRLITPNRIVTERHKAEDIIKMGRGWHKVGQRNYKGVTFWEIVREDEEIDEWPKHRNPEHNY